MLEKDKNVERLLSELDSHCVAGDIKPLSSKISLLMSTYFLRRLRERKIILRAPASSRRDIVQCILSCAQNITQGEYEHLANYLEFSIAGDAMRRRLLNETRKKIRCIGSCCESDILGLAYEIYNSEATRLGKRLLSGALPGKVAHDERRLHDLNGHLVDLSNALARLINEIGRLGLIKNNQRPLKRRDRKRALAAMLAALRPVGDLNSIEWIFDEVSFGHFVVTESGSKGSAFRLDFSDTKMSLMRRLATRRIFILKYMGARPERYVRDELNRIQGQLLDYALAYYSAVAGVSNLKADDVEKARKRARTSLAIIDAEDDLLWAASRGDQRVPAYYLAGFALSCFAIAGEVVREAKRCARVAVPIEGVPLSLINSGISINIEESFIAEGLSALSVALPARSHSQLNALSFVRDQNDVIRPFLHGFSGMWNIMARNALIQGGRLGKDVGGIWEGFIESCFKGTNWSVVGKGVKLRRGGQTVTEVDLLLLRDDLLLVVQIKSLIGAGDTAYDHWKNRQIVEMGCIQARKSVDFLLENPKTLASICGKRASAKINVIQPVVLTNIHHQEGASLFDVPVIGEATRKAICRGSIVDYFRSDGQHVHSHVFTAPEQLDTKEILRLLKEPVELRIACETPETTYREVRLGGLELLMPEFHTVSDPFQPPEFDITASST